MKPSQQKPNRLDRLDRLELIMADQDALGMNEETKEVAAPHAGSRHREPSREQARHLLHYMADEIGTRNDSSRKAGR